jgi:predicted glycoside hydrolase/deacetylase ChbG (UPF0249 family)
MRVIVNADDFGYSTDSVDATVELFDLSAISSASIMPLMPATARAMEFARRNPQWSFGVHLTFVSDGLERPVSNPRELSTLTDGRDFYGTRRLRLRALSGRLSQKEIAAEIRAQIGRVADAGIPVSHVDSHGHVHKLGVFQSALREVLPEFSIRCVRNAQNVYLSPRWMSPTYWLGAAVGANLKQYFLTTDHFFMAAGGGGGWAWAEQLLPRLNGLDGSLEVGVHPGYVEGWRRAEMQSTVRFRTELSRAGHALVNWRNLSGTGGRG